MMIYIYMVMNIHIYGTFEKESQWRVQATAADIYVSYIYRGPIDAEFDVEYRLGWFILPQKAV